MQVITNKGIQNYTLDTSGETDIATDLQNIFDELYNNGVQSVTFHFLPGIYYINKPLVLKFISVAIKGEAHGGVDIHGMNLPSGTIFKFGKDCFPNCISFYPTGSESSFPAKQTPWKCKATRMAISNINFMGYNNTDVDTQKGYSRFYGDTPNFRGLLWYPKMDRYADIERDGQRAIVLAKTNKFEKAEMLSIDSCYFTDLYVGLDIANSDVSNIRNSWFGQLVYAIRYQSAGQCIMLNDNCFADLETAVQLSYPSMSTLHNNTFAYVSKCFVVEHANELNINSNVVKNWAKATGTASCGAFLFAKDCHNLTVNSNTVLQALDSRVKSRTVDVEPNGRSFIHFEDCNNVVFNGNLFNTQQTEPVVEIKNCNNVLATSNMILFADTGSPYKISETSTNVLTSQSLY